MLELDRLPQLFSSMKARYAARDARMDLIDRVVRGDFSVFDPAEKEIKSRSPNLIQVALEDTAEAAASLPTIRVSPWRDKESYKRTAARMERIAAAYLEYSRSDLLVIRTVMDLAAYGQAAWVIWPDDEARLPWIERRNPRHFYPDPSSMPGDPLTRALFARQVPFTGLPEEWRDRLVAGGYDPPNWLHDPQVVIVEYFDAEEMVVAGLYQTSVSLSGEANWHPVELERIELKLGVCPVVTGQRITLDGEPRGQFDQVVGVLEAHIRLMGLLLDYADQQVYSDVWVRDLIGELSWGGGAFIELGPQGAIGRVPPAVSSLDVQRDLERLVDAIHIGGRWPKSRPGEIDQSIASAKFLEATAGMMNTAIRTYHQILRRMFERALRVCFLTDVRHFPGEKAVPGVLANQEFVIEYDPTRDIDLRNNVRAEYGLGLGRDPASSAVLMLQYAGQGFLSKEFVQENIEGLTDVQRERIRLDVEQFENLIRADLTKRVAEGSLPPKVLVEMIQARERGDSLVEIYRRWVAEPPEEQPQLSLPPTGPAGPLQGTVPPPPDILSALGLGGGGPALLPPPAEAGAPGGPPGPVPPGR